MIESGAKHGRKLRFPSVQPVGKTRHHVYPFAFSNMTMDIGGAELASLIQRLDFTCCILRLLQLQSVFKRPLE